MVGLLRIVLILVGALPLPLLHGFGYFAGTLLYLFPNSMRRTTLLQLQRCMPELSERERQRIARLSLINSAKAISEAPAIWFGPRWRLRRWLNSAQTQAQLHALIAGRKGVIMLSPHIGAWELAGLFCADTGAITSLYKPQKGAMDLLIYEGRCRNGATLVPTSTGGVKALLQALRNGEMVGILPDHDPPLHSGDFAPLFGITAHTTTLVGKLAARSEVPVYFIYTERLSWGRGFRHHLRVAPAGIGDRERGLVALNLGVEQVIRHLPEQYWWGYKRYRRQPSGAPNFYDPS
ncbi:MAG: lysophospholipid acyltransferase family protein [Pseudomonadota bacterium]